MPQKPLAKARSRAQAWGCDATLAAHAKATMQPYTLPTTGQIHVGTFVKTPAPQIIEILGAAGLQFAVLDAEHAPWDRGSMDLALLAGRAAGLPLFVRVHEASAAQILSALDLGAAGVLVPHVDSAEQARRALSHARYVGGERGYSSSPRAAGYGSMGMKEAIRRGDLAHVICQIESVAAVDDAAAIAAVAGVAGVFIGRADLALSMGLETTQHPRVDEATQHVMQVAKAVGKVIGVAVGSVAERERYVALGASWIVQASDQALLRQAANAMAYAQVQVLALNVAVGPFPADPVAP
jgi:2-keto-3-deoxy-L-rhamnonate aldolase RhmA